MQRWKVGLGLLTLVIVVLTVGVGAAQASAAPKLIECQHPVGTGEEVYALVDVSAKVACPVVLALGHWEYARGHVTKHITELYACVGANKRFPKLKLQTFEGWDISLTKAGAFHMSRGARSFNVTGTDFPLNCT